jgi:hypothetical protein
MRAVGPMSYLPELKFEVVSADGSGRVKPLFCPQ